jgi:hypothetical protein
VVNRIPRTTKNRLGIIPGAVFLKRLTTIEAFFGKVLVLVLVLSPAGTVLVLVLEKRGYLCDEKLGAACGSIFSRKKGQGQKSEYAYAYEYEYEYENEKALYS